MGDALTAQAAFRFLDAAVERNIYGCAGTGLLHVPYAQILHFITDLDAAHAFDAFIAFPDKRKLLIPGDIR